VERRPTLSVLRLVYTTTLGAQVYTTTSRAPPPPAVSGLWVQALVSGLLHSKIQSMRLLTVNTKNWYMRESDLWA
jgi:hypothetical protein